MASRILKEVACRQFVGAGIISQIWAVLHLSVLSIVDLGFFLTVLTKQPAFLLTTLSVTPLYILLGSSLNRF